MGGGGKVKPRSRTGMPNMCTGTHWAIAGHANPAGGMQQRISARQQTQNHWTYLLYARQCETALGNDDCRRVQDTGQFGPLRCDRETPNHSGNLCKRPPCFNLPHLKDIHLAGTHEVDGISQNLDPW